MPAVKRMPAADRDEVLRARPAYNIIATEAERWYWHAFWKTYEQPLVRSWIQALGQRTSACDIGCGTGMYLADLSNQMEAVLGLDISEGMLGRARQAAHASLKHGSNVRFIQGDVRRLPLRAGTIDAVLCARVLSNVDDLQGSIREIARICEPGSKLLITDIHPLHPYSVTRAKLSKQTVFVETYKHSIAAFRQALENAGFRNLELKEFGVAALTPPPDKKLFKKLFAHPERPVFFQLTAEK
jgi:ubiquinone/menaquinone biosynthesis C-methylase UbiE